MQVEEKSWGQYAKEERLATITAVLEKANVVEIRQKNKHMKVQQQREEAQSSKRPRIKEEVGGLRTEVGSDGQEVILVD